MLRRSGRCASARVNHCGGPSFSAGSVVTRVNLNGRAAAAPRAGGSFCQSAYGRMTMTATVQCDPLHSDSKRGTTLPAVSRAVVDLFIDERTSDFTVRELADHAGISERTFYRYFPRKEDVVRPFLVGGFERISALVAARPGGEPVRAGPGAAGSEAWVATDTGRSRRLYRLLAGDDALRATWFEVITKSEEGW